MIFAAYFLEAGLVLIVAPWSAFWDRNLFGDAEWFAPFFDSPVLRGAVSGVGLITAFAGFAELASAFLQRRSPDRPESSVDQHS